MTEKEKVKWILKNYTRAKAVGRNLKAASKNIEYSLQAKTAVGGSNSGGKSPSEQEKHLDRKSELITDAEIIQENVDAIEANVESLGRQERTAVRCYYFDDLTIPQTAKEIQPSVCERTAQNKLEIAVEKLVEWRLADSYKVLSELL